VGLAHFFNAFDAGQAPPQKVAVLGFAFKGTPPTGDVRGSTVREVIRCVRNRYPQAAIVGHDYLATAEDILSTGATEAEDRLASALAGAALVILHNDHPQYRQEHWEVLSKCLSPGAMIYDFCRQLDPEMLPEQSYRVFGRYGNGPT